MSDLEMMRNPRKWPNPVLPLVRRVEGRSWPECGVLLQGRISVIVGNMYDPEFYKRSDRIDYDSFEAVIEDGWVVD